MAVNTYEDLSAKQAYLQQAQGSIGGLGGWQSAQQQVTLQERVALRIEVARSQIAKYQTELATLQRLADLMKNEDVAETLEALAGII